MKSVGHPFSKTDVGSVRGWHNCGGLEKTLKLKLP